MLSNDEMARIEARADRIINVFLEENEKKMHKLKTDFFKAMKAAGMPEDYTADCWEELVRDELL